MKKTMAFMISFMILCTTYTPCVYAANSAFTRGSFCDKIIKTIGIEYDVSNIECPFSDLKPTDPYYAPILLMYDLGYIDGYNPGVFNSSTRMTNEGIAKVLTTMFFGDFSVPDDAELESIKYAKYAWKAEDSGLMPNISDWNAYAYENNIDYDLIETMISDIKNTEDIYLDLSMGSVTIKDTNTVFDLLGANDCVQNERVTRSTGNCIIRQSDTAEPTSNTITVSGKKANITIANINIQANYPIEVESGARLNLNIVGDNLIKAKTTNCIIVNKGAELTISGTGKITINGGSIRTGGNGTISPGGSSGGIPSVRPSTPEDLVTPGTPDYVDPGVGNWRGETAESTKAGKLLIKSGTVIAVSGENDSENYSNKSGISLGADVDILITGGIVTAIGSTGVGIGKSTPGGIVGGSGSIHIKNATVTANGYTYGIEGNKIIIENSTMNVSHVDSDGYDYKELISNATVSKSSYVVLSGNFAMPETKAYGHSGLSYQWQTSVDNDTWTDVAGQTSATAKIEISEQNDGNYYRCKLTNGWGNVSYTNSAKCYVLAFKKQPEDVYVSGSGLVAMEAQGCDASLTYQWECSTDGGKTYNAISGESYGTLLAMAELSRNNYLYRCILTAENGDTLASNPARIIVVTPVTSIKLDNTKLDIPVNSSGQINATLSPSDSTDVIEWTSDNPAVAIVDNTGKVTAISQGYANITATSVTGGATATCKVCVSLFKTFEVSVDGTQAIVRFSITELPSGARAYVAGYDNTGVLVDLKAAEFVGDTAQVNFLAKDIHTIKGYLWKVDKLQPVTIAIERKIK